MFPERVASTQKASLSLRCMEIREAHQNETSDVIDLHGYGMNHKV